MVFLLHNNIKNGKVFLSSFHFYYFSKQSHKVRISFFQLAKIAFIADAEVILSGRQLETEEVLFLQIVIYVFTFCNCFGSTYLSYIPRFIRSAKVSISNAFA